jgi:hypothetical protein
MDKPTELSELRILKEQWARLLPNEAVPEDDQLYIWLSQHESSTICKAFTQLAVKFKGLHGAMGRDHMIRFASAVMNRLSREASDRSVVSTTR